MQAPERERGVADPGVAVVPVALASGRLRERGRQRRDHAAGRRVHQPLQRQRRALQLAAPAVIGEPAPLEPAAPGLGRVVDPLAGVAGVAGQARVVGPGQRAEGVFVAAEPPRAPDPPVVVELEVHVGLEAERNPVDDRGRDAELGVEVPVDRPAPVVGAGLADQLDLGMALGTVGEADEHPLRLEAVAAVAGPDGVDEQRVADDDPAGLGRPGRLDQVRPRLVAARDRHPLVRREPHRPGAPVEDGAEDARRVEPRQAHPLDRAVGGDEGPGLAVGQESVGADPRELLQAGLRRAGGVPGVHGGDSTFPRTRLAGPRAGLRRPRRGPRCRARS